ncbi:MAG: FAD-dependent oxidoreductase [Acidimicrobiales bacterium]
MANVIIVGAGVAGLSAALTLCRDGHSVTLVERDATPLPSDAHGAFEWDRRGAPQVRHSHAFLARLRNSLRDRYPDVLDALFEAGATELDFISMLPEDMDPTPRPGDEDLVALACRRTTFEWVLRRLVLAEPGVELLDGVAVTGLTVAEPISAGDAPHVRGVVLDDGRRLDADLVVAAGGRRCGVPAMLSELGVDLAERTEDTGIVYFSRFFELHDGAEYPPQTGPIGGDLGAVKYGVFPGDNRTFSITLAVAAHDDELRRAVLDPDGFLRVAAEVPATALHVDGRATPIGGVHVMARLLNRRRHFTSPEGAPRVLGFSAVGDAHTCTNPLYGRGCSLAFVQAELLAESLARHPDDPVERARHYEQRCDEEILPWYRAAVAQDRATRAASEPVPDDGRVDGSTDAPTVPAEDPMRAMMRDGLLPAMRVDPVVVRAFLRMFNLLEPPDSLIKDFDVIGRVMTVYQDRDLRPPEPALGPGRDELLRAAIGSA